MLNRMTTNAEAPRERRAKKRMGGAWDLITLKSDDGKLIKVVCNHCHLEFQVASVTRVVDHFLGRAGVKCCTSKSDDFFSQVEKLKIEEEAKKERKHRKVTAASVTKIVTQGDLGNKPSEMRQVPLTMMKRSGPDDANEAVARFFFGNNIPTAVVNSQTFKDLVRAIRCAPLDWVPPERHKLADESLVKLTRKLRQQEAPLRELIFRNSGTVLSDGWDTVDRMHLVNQLVGTSEGIFFNGTVELRSKDHENADFITVILNSLITETGPLAVVHLCSDTCSVMKAAWRLIEEKFPWITTTPCGTHARFES